MSRRGENSPFDVIETLLDDIRAEEEAQLAVLEALQELDDREGADFPWEDFPLDDLASDERGERFFDECPP